MGKIPLNRCSATVVPSGFFHSTVMPVHMLSDWNSDQKRNYGCQFI